MVARRARGPGSAVAGAWAAGLEPVPDVDREGRVVDLVEQHGLLDVVLDLHVRQPLILELPGEQAREARLLAQQRAGARVAGVGRDDLRLLDREQDARREGRAQ